MFVCVKASLNPHQPTRHRVYCVVTNHVYFGKLLSVIIIENNEGHKRLIGQKVTSLQAKCHAALKYRYAAIASPIVPVVCT